MLVDIDPVHSDIEPRERVTISTEEVAAGLPVARSPLGMTVALELVDGWLFNLGATKPAANTIDAYRRDLVGVARRINFDDAGVLQLAHLTKTSLPEAFAL